MEFFLKEIEEALNRGLYFIALQSTLSLPDICGALASSDGRASGPNYIKWYNTYAREKGPISISGEDCYYFRCSCLHQGTSQNPKSAYKRIFFLVPNNYSFCHNNIFDDVLNIDINIFCKNIISAVRNWEAQAKNTDNYIKNYDKLIRVYPNGLPPYITGMPVIS